MVCHNDKNHIVFNCSFTYKGNNLNELLLLGPTLGATLQVRLLLQDRLLLCFLWRDLQREAPLVIYEWQVLPFGTTCSPCCATFTLQKHVFDHSKPGEDAWEAIEKCFYVDNHLQSLPLQEEAKTLFDKLRALLAEGGFELCQWASNIPDIINHLSNEARSEINDLWLSESLQDP